MIEQLTDSDCIAELEAGETGFNVERARANAAELARDEWSEAAAVYLDEGRARWEAAESEAAALRAEVERLRAREGGIDQLDAQITELRAEVERLRAESDAALAQTRADWFAELSAASARAEKAERGIAEARALLATSDDPYDIAQWRSDRDAWLATNPESSYPTLGHSGADEVFQRLRDHRGQSSLAEANPESPRAAAQDARWNMPEEPDVDVNDWDVVRASVKAASMCAVDRGKAMERMFEEEAPRARWNMPEEPDVDVSDWTVPRIERRGPTEAAERAVLDASSMIAESWLRHAVGASQIMRGLAPLAAAELARRAGKP